MKGVKANRTIVDNIHVVEYTRVNKRPNKKGDIVKHTLNIENVLPSFLGLANITMIGKFKGRWGEEGEDSKTLAKFKQRYLWGSSRTSSNCSTVRVSIEGY